MKVLSTIAVILFLMSFCGCATGYNEPLKSNLSEYAQSMPRRVSFKTLEEIDAYAIKEDTPEEFVHYDEISLLGDFAGYMVFLTPDVNYTYLYSLVDQNQCRISVTVTHFGNKEVGNILEMNGNMDSMLLSGGTESGWILRNGMKYAYAGGKLITIRWYVDNIEFTLSLDKPGCYPMDGESTFTKALLSTSDDEVNSAIKEFKTHLRNNR